MSRATTRGTRTASELLAAQKNRVDLFRFVKRLKIPFANHCSDLYVPANELTRRVLKRYPLQCASAVGFVNQVEGGVWFDIPFAFSPYWEKARASVARGAK